MTGPETDRVFYALFSDGMLGIATSLVCMFLAAGMSLWGKLK